MSDLAAVLTVAVAVAYGLGWQRAWSAAGRGRLVRPAQVWAFAAGVAIVLVALVGPVDARAHRSLTAHMVQHLLLLTVAPPLLVLGAPLPALRWALPPQGRRRFDRGWRRLIALQRDSNWVALAAVGVIVQSLVMLAWHAPVLFDGALAHPAVHGLEHLSFIVSACCFWWFIIGAGRRARYGMAVLAVFIACLPATALGAAMALADHSWYPGYRLADQQMAGVMMWSLGGLAYVIAAVSLFRSWMGAMERITPSRVVT